MPLSFNISLLLLSYFAGTATTKYHKQSGLKNGNLFSHGSGSLKSKIKVPAQLVSFEATLLGFQMAILLLPLYTVFSLNMHTSSVSLCVLISSYKEHWSNWIRAHSKNFILTYLCRKALLTIQFRSEELWV